MKCMHTCAHILPFWEVHVPICTSFLLEVQVSSLCCFPESAKCALLREHPLSSQTHAWYAGLHLLHPALPVGQLSAGCSHCLVGQLLSDTPSLLGCHSKVCHPQTQVFMLPFKLSSQNSVHKCLIWLIMIMSNLCNCYSTHSILGFGQTGLRAILYLYLRALITLTFLSD